MAPKRIAWSATPKNSRSWRVIRWSGARAAQELRRIDARFPLIGIAASVIGSTLLELGTEDQKRRRLPPIVRAERAWCQGYSEPGAGSDLASLQTRAEVRGEGQAGRGSGYDWRRSALHEVAMAVSERDRSYFRRIGEWKASLPPNSPPAPRTFDQVHEVMAQLRRGLSPPPTHGDDDAAVARLTEFRERLLQLEARRTGRHDAKRR